MSIKSTSYLTREEAIVLRDCFLRRLRLPDNCTNEELGDFLDILSETVCCLEKRPNFNNYLVKD